MDDQEEFSCTTPGVGQKCGTALALCAAGRCSNPDRSEQGSPEMHQRSREGTKCHFLVTTGTALKARAAR